VADAKWKVLDEEERKFGVAESDVYQLAAYAARYGTSDACLIYPMQEGFSRPRELRVHASPVSMRLVPFDIAARSLIGFAR
jgi:5-methylcytosine-specific restriction enzyme subunit McrC